MTLVETLVVRGEPDLVDAHLSFQLHAGVDFVLAAGDGVDGTTEILERYAGEGRLRKVPAPGSKEELEHLATEHGADWVLDAEAHEFWWPRGESLTEILAAIPKRYTAVQGLVRPFVPPVQSGSFFEQMTVRRSVERQVGEAGPAGLLKAVQRLGGGPPVPLRGWYPIEILTFADRSPESVDEQERERALAEGFLLMDTRLREAIRTLRDVGGELEFPIPDVVDDAAYAVECAAVGEVDLEALERRIDELEMQIARIERGFWTRVRGRVRPGRRQ
jgi:hypothetical protein